MAHQSQPTAQAGATDPPAAPPRPGPYRWGQGFVRSARLLAILVAVLGLGWAALGLVRLHSPWASVDPGVVEIKDLTEAMQASCGRARQVVAGPAERATPLPSLPTVVFPAVIRSARDLAAARAALASWEGYIQSLKACHLAEFDAAAAWLHASLTRRAAELRRQIQDEHGQAAAELQRQIDARRARLEAPAESLYRGLEAAEVQRRDAALEQAAELLGRLETSVGDVAAGARIAVGQAALQRLRAALPASSPEAERLRLVREIADLRRRRHVLFREGDRLPDEAWAVRLHALRLEVAETVQTAWAADADAQRLRARLDAAGVSLAADHHEQAQLRRRGGIKAAAILGLAGGLALGVLVLADTLRAFYDLAEAATRPP